MSDTPEALSDLSNKRTTTRAAPAIAVASALGLLAVGAIGFTATRPPEIASNAPSISACADVETELESAWGQAQRTAMLQHLDEVAPAWGAELHHVLSSALDSRTSAMRISLRDVCHERIPTVSELRCERWRILETKALVSAIAATPTPLTVAHAMDGMFSLSLPERCVVVGPAEWNDPGASRAFQSAVAFALGQEPSSTLPPAIDPAAAPADLAELVQLMTEIEIRLAHRSAEHARLDHLEHLAAPTPKPQMTVVSDGGGDAASESDSSGARETVSAPDAELRQLVERALFAADRQPYAFYALKARYLRLRVRPSARDFDNVANLAEVQVAPFYAGIIEAARFEWFAQDGWSPKSALYDLCAKDHHLLSSAACMSPFLAESEAHAGLDSSAAQVWVDGSRKVLGPAHLAHAEAQVVLAEAFAFEGAREKTELISTAVRRQVLALLAAAPAPPAARMQKGYELLARASAAWALATKNDRAAHDAEIKLREQGANDQALLSLGFVQAQIAFERQQFAEALSLARTAAHIATEAVKPGVRARAVALMVRALVALHAKPDGELGAAIARLMPVFALLPRGDRVSLRMLVANIIVGSSPGTARQMARAAADEADAGEAPAIHQFLARIPQ